MPRYLLECLHRETGQRRQIGLMADDTDDAVRAAGDLGFVVEAVKPDREPKPAPSTAQPPPPPPPAAQPKHGPPDSTGCASLAVLGVAAGGFIGVVVAANSIVGIRELVVPLWIGVGLLAAIAAGVWRPRS